MQNIEGFVDVILDGVKVWTNNRVAVLTRNCNTSITLYIVFLTRYDGPRNGVNSSPHSAAYMRQWTGSALFQIMACRQSLPELMLLIVIWCPKNEFQWTLDLNYNIFIQENVFENVVCENVGHFVQGEMS